MASRKSADDRADWSAYGETHRASAHRAEYRMPCLGLLALFRRERRSSFSVPETRAAGRLVALLGIAFNTSGL